MITSTHLLYGIDYKINDHITIHIPTISEIIGFGEEKYFSLVSNLIRTPLECKAYLYDSGVDYREVSDFGLFCISAKNLKHDDTKIILGDLDFSKLEFMINMNEEKFCLVYDCKVIIDKDTFNLMVDCIRKIHGITKSVEDSQIDENTKQYLIEKERFENRWNKILPYKPFLSTAVSMSDFVESLPISTYVMLLKS